MGVLRHVEETTSIAEDPRLFREYVERGTRQGVFVDASSMFTFDIHRFVDQVKHWQHEPHCIINVE